MTCMLLGNTNMDLFWTYSTSTHPQLRGPPCPAGHLRIITATVKVWSSAVVLISAWIRSHLTPSESQKGPRVCVRSCWCASSTPWKSVKCPSVERTSSLPITPLPATPLDSGQCAKQLWKRPHAFSLIEGPFRDVFFPTFPIFIRSKEVPTHFCHVRLVPLQVWHDGAHLDWVRVGHPVEIEWTGMSLLNR